MSAYMEYLIFNGVIQTIVCAVLVVVTCLLVRRMKQILGPDFSKQQKMVIAVTLSIFFLSVVCLLNDFVLSLFGSQGKAFPDGFFITGAVLWIPVFSVNLFYFTSFRSHERFVESLREEDLPRFGLKSAESEPKQIPAQGNRRIVAGEMYFDPKRRASYQRSIDNYDSSEETMKTEQYFALKRSMKFNKSSESSHRRSSFSSISRGLLLPDYVFMTKHA